jgi:hypothetical protein
MAGLGWAVAPYLSKSDICPPDHYLRSNHAKAATAYDDGFYLRGGS